MPIGSWYRSWVPDGKRAAIRASTSSGSSSRSGTPWSTSSADTARPFEPNQRWPTTHSCSVSWSRNDRSPRAASSRTSVCVVISLLQLEPEESARRQREQVRQLADAREARAAIELDRIAALPVRQVELDGLCRARHVVDAENDVVLVAADVREDAPVRRLERPVVAQAEDRVFLAQRDEAARPAQERRRRPELRLDVDRLIAVDRVHQRRQVELCEVGLRKAAVAVTGPLHRR